MLENSEATSTEYLSNEFRAGNLHLVRFLSVYKKATENIFEHAKTTGIYDPCELLNKQFDNESNPPTHESKKKKKFTSKKSMGQKIWLSELKLPK